MNGDPITVGTSTRPVLTATTAIKTDEIVSGRPTRITVQALKANSGTTRVYFSFSQNYPSDATVLAAQGIELDAGQSMFLDVKAPVYLKYMRGSDASADTTLLVHLNELE